MIDPLVSLALLTGILGSGHCLGMCGGLVAALSLAAESRRGGISFHLLYNLGRVLTYGGIGALAGLIGSAVALTDAFGPLTRILLLGSDLFVILLGLGTAGLWARLNVMRLEFSAPVNRLAGAATGLSHFPPALAALPLGLLFGLLPCGFVYAMAITAAQTTSALQGGAVMLTFGLGTAPSLFLFGSAAHWLSRRARSWMLRGAGLAVAVMGGYNLIRHLRLMGIW